MVKHLTSAVVRLWDKTSRGNAYFVRGKKSTIKKKVVRMKGKNKLLGAKFLQTHTHSHKHTHTHTHTHTRLY